MILLISLIWDRFPNDFADFVDLESILGADCVDFLDLGSSWVVIFADFVDLE